MADQNVVDLLLDQHDEIRVLMRQVKGTTGAEKQERFEELVRLLAVHETAEEEIVHPLARTDIESGERVVDELLHEEDEAKHALAELYDMGIEHPQFDAKFAALAESVEAHARHEEQEEFSRLRERESEDRLRSAAAGVRTAEATAPTRPHPAAGESAVANILVGPPVAIFDRVRDAVRDWQRT